MAATVTMPPPRKAASIGMSDDDHDRHDQHDQVALAAEEVVADPADEVADVVGQVLDHLADLLDGLARDVVRALGTDRWAWPERTSTTRPTGGPLRRAGLLPTSRQTSCERVPVPHFRGVCPLVCSHGTRPRRRSRRRRTHHRWWDPGSLHRPRGRQDLLGLRRGGPDGGGGDARVVGVPVGRLRRQRRQPDPAGAPGGGVVAAVGRVQPGALRRRGALLRGGAGRGLVPHPPVDRRHARHHVGRRAARRVPRRHASRATPSSGPTPTS